MFPRRQTIPPALKAEFNDMRRSQFNARVRVLGLTTLAVFYVSQAFAMLAGIQSLNRHYQIILGTLTVATVVMIVMSQYCKSLAAAKLNTYAYCLVLLWVLVNGPEPMPDTFTDVNFVFGLFFMALLMPWNMLDVIVLTIFHGLAWLTYFQSRDLSDYRLPSTFFGNDPFINGTVYLIITAVICMVTRYTQNNSSVSHFLLYKEVESKKAQMESELELAARVHQTLLPVSFRDERVDLAVTYRPVTAMGGDYARFIYAQDGRLVFLMADITGHGVPAALLVNRLHTEFNSLVYSMPEVRPSDLLDRLNHFILRDFQGTSMYLSGFCGVLDFKSRRLSYSNSGHPSQYIYRVHHGKPQEMKSHRTLLGIAPHAEGTESQGEVGFDHGDFLLFFTDGITELKAPSGEFFENGRLEKFLHSYSGDSPEIFNKRLVSDLENFSQGRFHDDILLITVRILAGQTAASARVLA